MATFLTKKKSIVKKPFMYLGIGLILILSGYLTFNYLNSTFSIIKSSLSNAITRLKDFIGPIISTKIPINAATVVTAILMALSIWFIIKGVKNLKHTLKDSEVLKILSKLPNDYYIFNDITLDNNSIDHVVICSKGIFTIDTKYLNIIKDGQKNSKKYNMIKQGILNSKLLNDFLQKNKVGNYFVNTVVVNNQWDDKLKENFSDIPVLKPEQLMQHISTLPDKYSSDECKSIADALNVSILTQVVHTNEKAKQEVDTIKKRNLNQS